MIFKVHLGEELGLLQLIQQVINPWQRISILDCHFFLGMVVNVNYLYSIIIWNCDVRWALRWCTSPDNSMIQQSLQLLLHFIYFYDGFLIQANVWQWNLQQGLNIMLNLFLGWHPLRLLKHFLVGFNYLLVYIISYHYILLRIPSSPIHYFRILIVYLNFSLQTWVSPTFVLAPKIMWHYLTSITMAWIAFTYYNQTIPLH